MGTHTFMPVEAAHRKVGTVKDAANELRSAVRDIADTLGYALDFQAQVCVLLGVAGPEVALVALGSLLALAGRNEG